MAGLWGRVFSVACALSAGLLLSACNLVTTEAPLFTGADAAPTPALREGVWIGGAKPDCRFDPAAPVSAWPKCATWFLVRGDIVSTYDADKDAWEHASLRDGRLSTFEDGAWKAEGGFLLVGGEPLIGQLGPGADDEKPAYYYLGLQPRFDEAGRVIELSLWPVACGPPPPEPKAGEKKTFVTQAPFPGLTVVDNNCTTSSPQALRDAARASRTLDGEPPTTRWLRDGDR